MNNSNFNNYLVKKKLELLLIFKAKEGKVFIKLQQVEW